MINKQLLTQELELIEKLLEVVNSKEEYEFLLKEREFYLAQFIFYRVERRSIMKMKRVYVFFENNALHFCYTGKKFRMPDDRLKAHLEVFWNHPSIKRAFLIRKSESGMLRSKIKVLDKNEDSKPVEVFTMNKNE